MDPRVVVFPRKLTFKPWQPNQAPTPHAAPVPPHKWTQHKDDIFTWHKTRFSQPQIRSLLEESGLIVTKDQLHTQMSEWKMTAKTRGSEPHDLHRDINNDVEEPIYGSLAEIDADTNSASLASYEPVRTYEKESSCASIQSLIPLQRSHPRNSFAVGTVFAVVGGDNLNGDKYKCNVWLVVFSPEDNFFCVRIKTYKGEGIAHLKGTDRQSDIDAHAVVHIHGETPRVLPAEPPMKKRPLAVKLEEGIDSSALHVMSRACFMGIEPMAYNIEAAVIGKLDKFSMALLQIYGKELCG